MPVNIKLDLRSRPVQAVCHLPAAIIQNPEIMLPCADPPCLDILYSVFRVIALVGQIVQEENYCCRLINYHRSQLSSICHFLFSAANMVQNQMIICIIWKSLSWKYYVPNLVFWSSEGLKSLYKSNQKFSQSSSCWILHFLS